MIIVFLVLAFLRTLHGVPIPVLSDSSLDIETLVTRDVFTIRSDDANTRSEYDIVKSCILTVLACVWTAAHPNIPGPRDSTWTIFKRRVVMMIYALIAPELMVLWALKQRVAARKIADQYNFAVVGLSNEENISLWSHLRNCLRGSWARAKGYLVRSPSIYAGQQNGPYYTPEDQMETDRTEKRSLWKRLPDSLKSLSASAKDSLKEMFIELPEARARRGKGQTWTTTHGLFIQMGGFLLYENDYPKQVLDYDAMEELIRNDKIDAPIYTEADIHDRSKGDAISKAVVVFQTTWFVIQCIARLCRGLPLSELEVVTLGFALLNGIIYAVWWHKPQGVGLAIFISLKAKQGKPESPGDLKDLDLKMSQMSHEEFAHGQQQEGEGAGVAGDPQKINNVNDRAPDSAGGAAEGDKRQTLRTKGSMERSRRGPSELIEVEGRESDVDEDVAESGGPPSVHSETDGFIPSTVKKSWLGEQLEKDRPKYHWLVFAFIRVPYRCGLSLLRPLTKMMDSYDVPDGAHRVLMFHVDSRGRDIMTTHASFAIGTVFGAVHLLAWSSAFPSRTELLLWRISTLIIIAEPVLMSMTGVLIDYKNTRLGKALAYIVLLPAVVAIPMYVIARFTLIILAFLSLHALPQSAFITIPWTSFIPHL